MRFDYQGAWRERFDRFSAFDSTIPNSAAGGRLGALAFAGTGPGRTGSRTFDKIPIDAFGPRFGFAYRVNERTDRKSTRLNSSHDQISYAVFCLKKKNIDARHS